VETKIFWEMIIACGRVALKSSELTKLN